MVGFGTPRFGILWFGILWFGILWFGTLWFGTLWFGTPWFGTGGVLRRDSEISVVSDYGFRETVSGGIGSQDKLERCCELGSCPKPCELRD